MITVRLNNENLALEKDSSIATALHLLKYKEQHFAVTLNQQFIPRTDYATTLLNEGDCVDIILPMQGG